MEELVTCEGTVHSVIFQNAENGYTVLRLLTEEGEVITVVGCIPCVAPGEHLAVSGTWETHPQHGEQVRVVELERSLPEDEDIAVIHHVKSSLTQKSKDVYFTLDANHRVEWLEQPFEVPPDKSTKQMIATSILKMRLANGPAKATDILEELKKRALAKEPFIR